MVVLDRGQLKPGVYIRRANFDHIAAYENEKRIYVNE